MTSKRLIGYSDDEMVDWSSAKDTDTEVEIPDVTGWRVMVLPLRVKKESEGGIKFSEETMEKEQLVMAYGRVLQVGPLAYTREDMLIDGEVKPWCKEGDLIAHGKYAGFKMIYKGFLLRILNDDEVLMVIPEDGR